MKLSLRKRALVALGLATALVFGAASPAHATWNYSGYSTFESHSEGGVSYGSGNADLFRWSTTGDRAYIEGYANKLNNGVTAQENSCIEVWVDQHGIDMHRPPDVFVSCRAGARYFPLVTINQMNYGSGGDFYPNAYHELNSFQYGINDDPDVVVCRVTMDGAAAWDRINPGDPGSTCTGSGLSVNPFHNRVGWLGQWGTTIENMNNDHTPQHIRVDGIGVLYTGETMVGGDLLVTYDGGHSARMQQDGNFVVRRHSDGAVLWAASWCGLTPVAGSTITMQSDGNLVIYGPAGNPGAKWASVNINTCGGGVYGGSTPHLEIPLNSNLRVMNGGSTLWDIA